MRKIRIECTFSHFGTKEEFLKKYPEKQNIVFEVDEFEGTDEEFHSGSFSEIVGVDEGETVREVIEDYFQVHNEEFTDEYFSIKDVSTGKELYTEDDFNFKMIVRKMRKFDEVTKMLQKDIRKKFEVPTNTEGIYVDKFDRPFELIAGSKVALTVKSSNFHIHELKNR